MSWRLRGYIWEKWPRGRPRMIYTLDEVELDLGRVELRRAGEVVAVEPQVFSLLSLLIENHDRMVSRDEIVERVGTAALSRRRRSRAGSSGSPRHRRRRGYANRSSRPSMVAASGASRTSGSPRTASRAGGGRLFGLPSGRGTLRPSIAVLPFPATGLAETQASLGDAIPHEVISALSRLRWLKVISRARASGSARRTPMPARSGGRSARAIA